MAVPKFDDLFNPLLSALQNLGGSGTVKEQEDEVARILNLSEKDVNEIHKGSRTKLSYYLAWARNYLKNFGLLENSARGVWALTERGRQARSVDKKEVKRFILKLKEQNDKEEVVEIKDDDSIQELTWKEELLDTVKTMNSSSFERLCMRVLRESGFVQVEVTGKSGDGGIDGKGVVKIGGLLSFRVFFQCKRYKESVGAEVVRNFQGAMIGRADKGLLITTGTFSR